MFWSLPRKLFENKFFTVQHVETEQKEQPRDITVNISTNDAYLTVYNSPKVYNLLTSVLYKKKLLNENQNSKIYNQCTIN